MHTIEQQKPSGSGGGVAHRFAKSSDGTASIEMAILAPIFLTVVIATCFAGLDFATSASLDSAIVGSVREVARGDPAPVPGSQSSGGSWSVDTLTATVCQKMLWPGMCDTSSLTVQAGVPSDGRFGTIGTSFVDIQSGQMNLISISSNTSFLKVFVGRELNLGASYLVYVP